MPLEVTALLCALDQGLSLDPAPHMLGTTLTLGVFLCANSRAGLSNHEGLSCLSGSRRGGTPPHTHTHSRPLHQLQDPHLPLHTSWGLPAWLMLGPPRVEMTHTPHLPLTDGGEVEFSSLCYCSPGGFGHQREWPAGRQFASPAPALSATSGGPGFC